uniref:Uncharacterized protein n=1 Tax=Rhizophora mucronata TaxID=61149 RepID=A0A2P2KDE4_RHIMU
MSSEDSPAISLAEVLVYSWRSLRKKLLGY